MPGLPKRHPCRALPCPRCGAALAPVLAQPTQPSSSAGKIVLIIVVVVVLDTVVLAAVLYRMVSGLIGSGRPTSPLVALNPTQALPGNPDAYA